MKKALLKRFGVFGCAVMIIFTLCACGNANNDSMNKIGETYSMDTWDITVNSIELLDRVYVLAANSYFTAKSGNILVLVNMSATLKGNETDTFMPLNNITSPAPQGSVRAIVAYGDTTIQRSMITGGTTISQWTVANTETAPGDTVEGFILFETTNEARESTKADFLLKLYQNDKTLIYDLKNLPEPEPKPELVPTDIGDTVVFDQFEITLTNYEIVDTFETKSYYYEPDEGNNFVVVYLTINNTGDSEETPFKRNTTMYDTRAAVVQENGDTSYAMYTIGGQSLIDASLVAGEKVEGFLIFEINKDAATTGTLDFMITNKGTGNELLYHLQ